MSTLDLCEKYFNTRDLYELLEVSKDATSQDIKKAYYKLSLQVHPDRVSAEEKDEATEKFKVLSKVHQVLSDKDKRAVYDEQGSVEDDELESKLSNWLDLWRCLFKPLTTDAINKYEKSYLGSELERSDIKKAYLNSKGCINAMMEAVPFLKVADEPRLQTIVREMIDAEEVPEYKQFTEESPAKRKRRHQKYLRQSKLVEEKQEDTEGIIQMMEESNKRRANNFCSLMDSLVNKYGKDDDSEGIDLKMLGKKRASKRKVSPKQQNAATATKKMKGVKSGKVNKTKKRN